MILIDIKTIKLYMKYEEIPYYSKKNMRYFLVHNSKKLRGEIMKYRKVVLDFETTGCATCC